MLFVSKSSSTAVNVPYLLLVTGLLLVMGAAFSFVDDPTPGKVLGALVSLGIVLLAFTELRWMRVSAGRLQVRTVFTTRQLLVSTLALGIRVRHGRGIPTYTVYALGGRGTEGDDSEIDLAEASRRKTAERMRDRLSTRLLGRSAPSFAETSHQVGAAASDAHRRVEARERRQIEQVREAQRLIDAYYANGRHWRVAAWVIGGVVLYLLAMGGYLFLSSGN